MLLSIWKLNAFKYFSLLKVKNFNFTAFSCNTLMCDNCSSFDHCPPVSIILYPISFLINRFVFSFDCETETSNGHCKFLNISSIEAVFPWNFCLESLFWKMTSVFLIFVFALGTWHLFVLEVLLEWLKTFSLV